MSAASQAAGLAPDPVQRIMDLARAAGALLVVRRLCVVTAESCTGGGIAYALTQIPGSSAWFERGMIVYSDEAKRTMLDVPDADLRAYGAVSEPVAAAMACGALQHSTAQLALAVTGIAGPAGGTPAKPVGTVCFAWARRGLGDLSDPDDACAPARARTATVRLPGDRAAVRTRSIQYALEGLCEVLHEIAAYREAAAPDQARPRRAGDERSPA